MVRRSSLEVRLPGLQFCFYHLLVAWSWVVFHLVKTYKIQYSGGLLVSTNTEQKHQKKRCASSKIRVQTQASRAVPCLGPHTVCFLSGREALRYTGNVSAQGRLWVSGPKAFLWGASSIGISCYKICHASKNSGPNDKTRCIISPNISARQPDKPAGYGPLLQVHIL